MIVKATLVSIYFYSLLLSTVAFSQVFQVFDLDFQTELKELGILIWLKFSGKWTLS